MSYALRIARPIPKWLLAMPLPAHSVERSGCWAIRGIKPNRRGYVRVERSGFKAYAHRLFYSVLCGPVPTTLSLDHVCKNKACVNPRHLEIVPIAVNILRADAPPAMNAAKTHCIRGHEFTLDNIGRQGNGGRYCRACAKLKYYERVASDADYRRRRAESAHRYNAKKSASRVRALAAVIEAQEKKE